MSESSVRPQGVVRAEPWLSLQAEAQQVRQLIVRLAREIYECVLVGNPAPVVADRFHRMTNPLPGDLVVENSRWLRWSPLDHRSVGYLLETRLEHGERVWYVQYGPEPQDVCRWANADFVAVDIGSMQ